MSRDPYRIRLDRPLGREVSRLIRGQVNRARRSLKAPTDETVHTARKAVKRARAVLRLVRGGLPRERMQSLDHELKAAGRRMGPVRDMAVARELVEMLRTEGVLGAAAAVHLSAFLDAERAAAWDVLRADDGIEGIRVDLDRVRLAPTELAGLDALTLHDGLATTYRRGCERLTQAVEAPSAHTLHAWRRQVKHLGYQMRLVAPAWPIVLGPTARALDALGSTLGDDHDLAELARVARQADLDPAAVRAIQQLTRTRRTALQTTVWPLGARLYAEGATGFAGRMTVYLAAALAEARHAPVRAVDGMVLLAPLQWPVDPVHA